MEVATIDDKNIHIDVELHNQNYFLAIRAVKRTFGAHGKVLK